MWDTFFVVNDISYTLNKVFKLEFMYFFNGFLKNLQRILKNCKESQRMQKKSKEVQTSSQLDHTQPEHSLRILKKAKEIFGNRDATPAAGKESQRIRKNPKESERIYPLQRIADGHHSSRNSTTGHRPWVNYCGVQVRRWLWFEVEGPLGDAAKL